MKFIHLADCHLGGWREEKLRELNIETFRKAVDFAIKEYIGFVLISGDLFDTALPDINLVKDVAHELSRLKEHDIPVYIIAGSHDFSPSGKTIIDVFEKADLFENVAKLNENKLDFTLDRTGTKITGLFGKKGSLEKKDYEILDKLTLEQEQGFKIFMFHSTLNEFKPKDMEKVEGSPLALLPKNFDYYAGGHVHFIFEKDVPNYGKIVYPGPLFPNNLKELEDLKQGGFYFVEVSNKNINAKHIPIKLVDVESYFIDANDKLPQEVIGEINNIKNFENKIIILRIEGSLRSGKPSDIDFKSLLSRFEKSYIVLKNTSKFTTKEKQEFEIKSGSVEEVEENIIKDFKSDLFDSDFAFKLIDVLDVEKEEGERNIDFENRLISNLKPILEESQNDRKNKENS